MRSTLFRYASLLLCASMATAQDTRSLIVPAAGTSSFPACAVNCAVLQQAQTACQPSATTQLAFEQCFCTSAFLGALYSTPDAICTAECPTASDRTLLQSWYSSFCGQVGQGIDPLTVVPTTAATTLVTVTNTGVVPGATTSTPPSYTTADANKDSNGPW
jgi:hypothetical protein